MKLSTKRFLTSREGAKKEISEVSVSVIPPKAELRQNRKSFSPIKRKKEAKIKK